MGQRDGCWLRQVTCAAKDGLPPRRRCRQLHVLKQNGDSRPPSVLYPDPVDGGGEALSLPHEGARPSRIFPVPRQPYHVRQLRLADVQQVHPQGLVL